MINADLGLRASARSQTTRIARSAIKAGLKTIVFANTRLMVEVLTKYLKDVFDSDPRQAPRIAAYRGGYLPTARRDTATRLRGGKLDCVVATNALELGVDIGGLDVCLLNGFPGTIAGTWQRLAAGRRNRPAMGVLIATSDPLDQYIIRNPEFFTAASPERGCIDPDQLLILMDHIRCAAFELAFHDDERFGSEPLAEMLGYLESQGVLHHEGQRWHWMADSYPASSVSLRSVADGNFVVVDVTGGKQDIIAEVDYSSAALTLYEGAIYLIQANPWQVEKLDWKGARPSSPARRPIITPMRSTTPNSRYWTALKKISHQTGETGQTINGTNGLGVQTRRVRCAAAARCIWCAALRATRRYATTRTKTSVTAR